jgi:penicillin-binding protein 1A
VNTVFAQLIEDVGPTDVAEMARAMGIKSYLPDGDASIALGTAEVNPLEMAAAFATLSSGGVYREPTPIARLVDSGEEVLEELDPDGERVLPKNVALLETAILQEVVRYGTGTGAQLDTVDVAGKTGTTDDNSDAWFCGYTTKIATCVWVGYPDARTPMDDVHGITVTGGSFPADIWRTFMQQIPDVGGDFDSPTSGPYAGPAISTPSPEPTGSPSVGPSPVPPPSPSPTPSDDGGIIPTIFPSPTPSTSPSPG